MEFRTWIAAASQGPRGTQMTGFRKAVINSATGPAGERSRAIYEEDALAAHGLVGKAQDIGLNAPGEGRRRASQPAAPDRVPALGAW